MAKDLPRRRYRVELASTHDWDTDPQYQIMVDLRIFRWYLRAWSVVLDKYGFPLHFGSIDSAESWIKENTDAC